MDIQYKPYTIYYVQYTLSILYYNFGYAKQYMLYIVLILGLHIQAL